MPVTRLGESSDPPRQHDPQEALSDDACTRGQLPHPPQDLDVERRSPDLAQAGFIVTKAPAQRTLCIDIFVRPTAAAFWREADKPQRCARLQRLRHQSNVLGTLVRRDVMEAT